MPGPIRCRVWREGDLALETADPDQVVGHVTDPDTLVWVDLVSPEPDELAQLGAQLGLGRTGLEDALADHERPKVVRHSDHLSFTAYATSLVAGRLRLHRVSGFVLPAALITVRPADGVDMDRVLARWVDNGDLLRFGPGALLHGLLDHVVDDHFTTIQAYDEQIERLEDDLLVADGSDQAFVRRLYAVRKDLVELRRVVLPMREIVSGLLRHRAAEADELARWYDDLYDHVLRAAEWTESLRDLVTTLFETHLSLQDIRLNVVMKQLAAWAAIIAIPTAITGWFGQNIPYPGYGQPFGFWLSSGLVATMSLGLYGLFRRRGWL